MLRTVWLSAKPPHFDEGVNGWFVDQMIANGFYHYDPTNFHGPLHFYLLFIAQTLFGRHIWALRLPVALISTLAVAQTLAFRRFLSPATCRLAALAMALSPAMVFYGRYAIHESEMLSFLLLIAWGLLGLSRTGAFPYLAAVALGATGCILTKETYIIHFFAFALAWPALRTLERWKPQPLPALHYSRRDLTWLAAICLGLIVFFYSGNLLDWSSLPGVVTTFGTWVRTGTDSKGGHNKDWWYWFTLIGQYEWPLAAGVLGSVWIMLTRETRSLRYLALAGWAVLTGYSIVRYKTPWCLIVIAWPFLFAFGETLRRLARLTHPVVPGILAAALMGHSARASLRLNFRHATDENEPYVYVQTLPAIERILEPLRWLVARDPARLDLTGYLLFQDGDGHPLPWLLAEYPRIEVLGEHDAKPGMDADVLVVDDAYVSDIEERLHERYFRESLVIRGNSGETAMLYFRASVFAPHFPGREPEFTPAAP